MVKHAVRARTGAGWRLESSLRLRLAGGLRPSRTELAMSGDAVSIAPDVYSVVLENERSECWKSGVELEVLGRDL